MTVTVELLYSGYGVRSTSLLEAPPMHTISNVLPAFWVVLSSIKSTHEINHHTVLSNPILVLFPFILHKAARMSYPSLFEKKKNSEVPISLRLKYTYFSGTYKALHDRLPVCPSSFGVLLLPHPVLAGGCSSLLLPPF